LAAAVAILLTAWSLAPRPPEPSPAPPATAEVDPVEAVRLFAGCVDTGLRGLVGAGGNVAGRLASSAAAGLSTIASPVDLIRSRDTVEERTNTTRSTRKTL